MRLMILLLLMSLSGCSTKTIKEIKTSQIPEKYLKCENYADFNPSDKSRDSAVSGDFKLIYLELVDLAINNNKSHNQCYNNANDAKEYQKRMKVK